MKDVIRWSRVLGISLVLLCVTGVPAQAKPLIQDETPGHLNTRNTKSNRGSRSPQISLSPENHSGILHHRKNVYNIRSKHYRIVFPTPPATSKEEYIFEVSIGSNGELSYYAACPTSGTSLGLGILLGNSTFADNNINLPKACTEVQRATEDLINLKQGRDAANQLGRRYRLVLEKAIFLRGLRALAYTDTQLKGLLNRQEALNQFLPHKTDIASRLTTILRERKEDQIEILKKDSNRLQSIIISTGHDFQGLIQNIRKETSAAQEHRSTESIHDDSDKSSAEEGITSEGAALADDTS